MGTGNPEHVGKHKKEDGSMKDESCKTCKHRTGSLCKKNEEHVEMMDWCSAYKFKNEQSVIDRFFVERRIAQDQNIFKHYTRSEMV